MAEVSKMNEEELKKFQTLLAAPLPRFYVNSFMNAVGLGDVTAIFQANGQNVAVFNFTMEFAKTFAGALSELVLQYEQLTGHPVTSGAELQKAVEAVKAEGKHQ